MRVVVISAWVGQSREVLQELGLTDVLEQPLRLQQLTDLISHALHDTERSPAASASDNKRP